jgi:hypothetical protein
MDIESLREIVKKGKFHAFPKEFLNQEFLSQKNKEDHNFSMLAVIHKHIKSAPPEFLTKELLNFNKSCGIFYSIVWNKIIFTQLFKIRTRAQN